MNNLEELKKKYEELGKEIKRLEKEKSCKRWRAEAYEEEDYYYIDEYGEIADDYDTENLKDNFCYKTRNYFETEDEAQIYLDNINTYYDLMDLAEELNNGEEINWKNNKQEKLFIFYDNGNDEFTTGYCNYFKHIGEIYCLNENFLEIALEKIGKERLEKLFKN